MTPPLFQIGLYYHASIFVEFENVRHYHMYSKVYSKVYSKEHSNTYSTVYSNELSSIEVSLECIVSNVTVASTTRS